VAADDLVLPQAADFNARGAAAQGADALSTQAELAVLGVRDVLAQQDVCTAAVGGYVKHHELNVHVSRGLRGQREHVAQVDVVIVADVPHGHVNVAFAPAADVVVGLKARSLHAASQARNGSRATVKVHNRLLGEAEQADVML